jgi:hypothetical protein
MVHPGDRGDQNISQDLRSGLCTNHISMQLASAMVRSGIRLDSVTCGGVLNGEKRPVRLRAPQCGNSDQHAGYAYDRYRLVEQKTFSY